MGRKDTYVPYSVAIGEANVGNIFDRSAWTDLPEQIDLIRGIWRARSSKRDTNTHDFVCAVVDIPEVPIVVLIKLQRISNSPGENLSLASEIKAAIRGLLPLEKLNHGAKTTDD